MASSEKPSAKIFVSVASSLILATLTYFGRHILLPAWHWVAGIFIAVWSWITSNHLVPGWLLLLLSPCGAWCLFRIFIAFRAPARPEEPTWHDFTEFEFLGVLWRWQYDRRGAIHTLVSFCLPSNCDMQTYGRPSHHYGAFQERTAYDCDRCGHTSEIPGSQECVEDKVLREIQRLLRCGDWKKHIRPNA